MVARMKDAHSLHWFMVYFLCAGAIMVGFSGITFLSSTYHYSQIAVVVDGPLFAKVPVFWCKDLRR
eukprot:SAG31_NODE_18725_length_625_cov_0.880228_1_plen_66_part_00